MKSRCAQNDYLTYFTSWYLNQIQPKIYPESGAIERKKNKFNVNKTERIIHRNTNQS